MKNLELANLCYQLWVVFKSGLPISEGIRILAEDCGEKSDPETLKILSGISDSLDRGASISESFEMQQGLPKYLRSMIAVGDSTGKLPQVLNQLTKFYEGRAHFAKKVKSAVISPLIMLVMMTMVLFLMIFKVLPIFHSLIASFGGEIPKGTMIIFSSAKLLEGALISITAVLVIVGLFVFAAVRTGAMPAAKNFILTKTPLVGRIYKKAQLVKFTRAVTTLVASGYSFEVSAEKALPLMDDKIMEKKIAAATLKYEETGDIYGSLEGLDIFPSLFFSMIRLGVKTGTIEEMTERFTITYQEELDRLMEKTADSIEPAIVTVISVITGTILIMTLLPLIGIISAVG